jgi:hypothetical protein
VLTGWPPQVQVPLGSSDPSQPTPAELVLMASMPMGMGAGAGGDDSLLPPTRLAPRTLLGGDRGGRREAVGHMYAAHIAGQLALADPHDRRTVLVGVGMRDGDAGAAPEDEAARMAHFDMLDLLQRVL